MTRIRIKRVYEKASPDDGRRVLIDKLWPRGLRKDMLPYDLWARQLAPSDDLRRWYHEDPAARWTEFCRRYREELRRSTAVRDFLQHMAGTDTVTLLYASKNAVQNHALVLRDFLQHALAVLPQTVTTA